MLQIFLNQIFLLVHYNVSHYYSRIGILFIWIFPFCRKSISLSSIVLRIWRIRVSAQSGNLVLRNWVWIQNLLMIVIVVNVETRFVFYFVLLEIPCSHWDNSIVYIPIFCHSIIFCMNLEVLLTLLNETIL